MLFDFVYMRSVLCALAWLQLYVSIFYVVVVFWGVFFGCFFFLVLFARQALY